MNAASRCASFMMKSSTTGPIVNISSLIGLSRQGWSCRRRLGGQALLRGHAPFQLRRREEPGGEQRETVEAPLDLGGRFIPSTAPQHQPTR